jgi:hypothetical protein
MSGNQNIMEDYIRSIIKDEIHKQIISLDLTLKEEDASKIILAIMPHLDQLIAKRVKQHFVEMADLVKSKFKNKEKS